MLDELHGSMANPDAGLVRSTLVVHHRRASLLSKSGQHEAARPHWQVAHQIWFNRISGRRPFWKDFLAAYNAGKGYQVNMTDADLEKTMRCRMAGACITLAGVALGQQRFEDAAFYWQEACKIGTESDCKGLFKEVVSIDDLIRKLNVQKDPRAGAQLFSFLYEEIEQSDVHRKNLVEFRVRLAIQGLKARDFSRFYQLMDSAGQLDHEYVQLTTQMRRLSNGALRCTVESFQAHPAALQFARTNPVRADIKLFSMVLVMAQLNDRFGGCLTDEMINRVFDSILIDVLRG